eukprot:2913851-Amphidinium_carterae.1
MFQMFSSSFLRLLFEIFLKYGALRMCLGWSSDAILCTHSLFFVLPLVGQAYGLLLYETTVSFDAFAMNFTSKIVHDRVQ